MTMVHQSASVEFAGQDKIIFTYNLYLRSCGVLLHDMLLQDIDNTR